MEIIETHAHLDLATFDEDRPQVLERARQAGVRAIVNIALHPAVASRTLRLVESDPALYAAVGIHPHAAADYAARLDAALDHLRRLAAHPRVVALGEMGLDFHRDHTTAREQQAVFEAQLELARELDLPVVIHCRAAEGQVMAALHRAQPKRVVMHCFSGDEETARLCASRGYYIGVGGVLTFPNAHRLRRVARDYPRDLVVLETDSPFLAPQPRRGKRNEPSYLIWVAEALGSVWGVDATEAAAKTAENARRLFGLPSEPVGANAAT